MGPGAGLPSSKWIARAAKWFEDSFTPNLNLVYLPHLDYNLQRLGPDHPSIADDLQQIDAVAEDLVSFLENKGVEVIILSEYGITPVHQPIHINRELRKKGWICCREELGREQIDLGNCKAFSISDHQLAHIYVLDSPLVNEVKDVVENLPGVSRVLAGKEIEEAGLLHERSGDLVAVSEEDRWFTYYYWDDDSRAPDFARCVDIHRKPGYDPVELFLDPALSFPKVKIGAKLLSKKLGFRYLMNLIPLNPDLVKGSHGCIPKSDEDYPVLIGNFSELKGGETIPATEVFQHLLQSAKHENK